MSVAYASRIGGIAALIEVPICQRRPSLETFTTTYQTGLGRQTGWDAVVRECAAINRAAINGVASPYRQLTPHPGRGQSSRPPGRPRQARPTTSGSCVGRSSACDAGRAR